jgi:hypothetical protein
MYLLIYHIEFVNQLNVIDNYLDQVLYDQFQLYMNQFLLKDLQFQLILMKVVH